MFDVLLSLVEKNQAKLIEIYLKELSEKGEGLFSIIQDGKKADIRYYSPDKLPYPNIEKEYKEKKMNTLDNNQVEVKDKWIITLPILEIETDKDTVIPIWNLILDDGKTQVYFQGFPQEVDLKNGEKGLQYVLVAEPHESNIAKNNWTVEATTTGQKYLQKCLTASRDYYIFLTFRSDSDFCKIIIHGKKEDGDKILERISNNQTFIDNLNNFRKNDNIGSPVTYKYGKYGHFSPNTLRYINTTYELKQHFSDINNWKILEFGGGYGGLCHILSYITKWNEYDFVEINEPLELSKKCFLSIPLKNVNCLLPENVEDNKKWDLFISEFGFCELNEEGQNKCMFMLKNSKNAYLSMNLWDKNKKKKLKDKLLGMFKTVEEYPVFLKSEWGDYIWVCKN